MGKHKGRDKKYFDPDDGYIALAAAVLLQAVEDYKEAVKRNRKGDIKALERFFLSEYGQFLSFGHGEYIIEKLHKEAEQANCDGMSQNK